MERNDNDSYYYDRFHSNVMSYSLTELSPASSEHGTNFFFTEEPNKLGWNETNSNYVPVIQNTEQDDDGFEDHVVGKSYDAFEMKLKEGFLEAPNLGLVSVPPAMFDYQPPLQRIDLKENKIELLPEYFFDELPMLTWCDLRYNRIQTIPPIAEEHKNLKVLLLQDNQLTSLPYQLAHAVNLQTFGWTNNNISDPPRLILLQGCKSIMQYLRSQLAAELSPDSNRNQEVYENDDQLKKDLAKTARKHAVRRTKSRNSIISGESVKSSTDLNKKEEEERKRRIDRLKYTWDLWKSIPYNGVSNHTLFEKSVQEVKDEVKAKLNQHREAILQKMKDNDALGKWRWESKMLQMKGPSKPYDGVQMPFGTEADLVNEPDRSSHELMDPAKFRTTMAQCMKRLQLLAENPTPINDTEKSLERLKEVEEIQRKLFDMKLKWSVKSSNPT